jgi:predicted nucleic acid-binding protein
MLYLDASALVKRYFVERGSAVVAARFDSGEQIFTSMISFAEVHSAIGRKLRSKEVDKREFVRLRDAFENDWLFSLNKLDVDLRTMTALPQLVQSHALKAGDAIQLSTAVWLRDSFRSRSGHAQSGGNFEFGVADKKLGKIASQYGLQVFDPEEKN